MDKNTPANEIKEEQLSITLDDIEEFSAAANKMFSKVDDRRSHIEISKEIEKKKIAEKGTEKEAEKAAVTSEKQGVGIPDNKAKISEKSKDPQTCEKAAPKAEKTDEKKPEKPSKNSGLPAAPKLSDMEVMEHTASIWQYKEIVDNGTEMHSEYHQKHVSAPFADVVGARVRGKKHKHEGTNCDDFFETAVTEDCVIAVVCDGAGSRPLSRIGSRVSAETASAYLKEKLTDLFEKMPTLRDGLSADLNSAEFMAACGRIAAVLRGSAGEAFAAQQKQIQAIFDDKKYEDALGRKPVIGDLGTTFLAAVIVPLVIDGKPQNFMACVQIGDGCICALDSAAESSSCLKLMGEADSGKFSGETDFLSEKNSDEAAIGAKTRISRGSSDVVLLMSDGVADDYFPAQPMMKRLYLDLCLNGIFPMERGDYSAPGGEDPAPIRFRSVSVSQQSVALQYSKQLLSEKTGSAVNALWDKRDMLYCHSLEAFRMNIGDTPEERLRVWLDNYNERGSFDDRTLVAVRMIPTK